MNKMILSISLILAAVLFPHSQHAQDLKHIKSIQKEIMKATADSDCQSLLIKCDVILDTAPNHPIMNYLAARLNALLGNEMEAIELLKKATQLGYGLNVFLMDLDISNDAAFDVFRETERFTEITQMVSRMGNKEYESQVAFTLKDRSLIPEGIAYDPVDRLFFIGSMAKRKVVSINSKGIAKDFIKEKQNGLGIVLGMEVDVKRRVLWICSGFHDGEPYSAKKVQNGWTSVFKYDLSSNKFIKKYVISQKEERHEFNDLVVSDDGDVFITDSEFGAIYTISKEKDELEIFIKSDRFVSPNGISFNNETNTLYMADFRVGVHQIDIKTKNALLISRTDTPSTYGIDGLYFYKNGLVGVQLGLGRVSQFYLNESGEHVEKMKILNANTPIVNLPTTGVIVDDAFYFIANTEDEFSDITILKVDL